MRSNPSSLIRPFLLCALGAVSVWSQSPGKTASLQSRVTPASLPGSTPQWHTLATEAYPKKRDDIVFADARTGFYGTGKGNLYRTQDGGNSWQLIWSKPGTFVR